MVLECSIMFYTVDDTRLSSFDGQSNAKSISNFWREKIMFESD